MTTPQLQTVNRLIAERPGLSKPVIHPNGFIQLDCRRGRMHFWHPEIPRQKVSTAVHDHIFDMQAEVLLGVIMNHRQEIQPEPDGYYEVHVAIPTEGKNTELVPIGKRVRLDTVRDEKIRAGEDYLVEAFEFHRTSEIQAAVTLMNKINPRIAVPRALVPFDQKPDNDFKRDDFDEKYLWTFIHRIIQEAVIGKDPA